MTDEMRRAIAGVPSSSAGAASGSVRGSAAGGAAPGSADDPLPDDGSATREAIDALARERRRAERDAAAEERLAALKRKMGKWGGALLRGAAASAAAARVVAAAALAAASVALPLAAQDAPVPHPVAVPRDSIIRVAHNRNCNGQPITEITVDARRPPFAGASGRWRRIARTSSESHHALIEATCFT
jgi:hypothetical protein